MSEAVVYEVWGRYSFISKNIAGHLHLHSYYDEPAYIELQGRGCYYSYWDHRHLHRDDAPARIFSDDRQEYYNNGIQYTPKCQKL